jgi:3-mercaptopyruvate sulfurtransferase SseA
MAKLIGAAELKPLLDAGSVKVYEIDSPKSTNEAFARCHIKGAAWVDVAILTDPESKVAPVDRPTSPVAFGKLLGELGLADTSESIVLYAREPKDGSGHAGTRVMWATRAWWTLWSWGFTNVMLLDGCFESAWRSTGNPVSEGDEKYPPKDFDIDSLVDHGKTTRVSTEEMVRLASEPGDIQILDSLSGWPHTASRWDIKGHIKGAANVSFVEITDPVTGRFMEKEPFQAYVEKSFDLSKPIVAY